MINTYKLRIGLFFTVFALALSIFGLANMPNAKAQQTTPDACQDNSNVFSIGDIESDLQDNIADELNWPSPYNLGDFTAPFDNPFVAGTSSDTEFPWNSRPSVYADDFTVEFTHSETDALESQLTFSWSPGRSGNETKEIYLDGSLVATVNRAGGTDSANFMDMPQYTETIDLGTLSNGAHTLRFVQTTGDGSIWDYVTVDVTNCSDSFIQGRKYFDDNQNGVFDRNQGATDYRMDDWTIILFDDQMNELDRMQTGDDTTSAGNMGVGQYRFENLPIGEYIVCEERVLDDEWIQTQPASGPTYQGQYCFEVSITDLDQGVGSRRFGNYHAAEIRFHKIIDWNNDGWPGFNSGEPHQQGWAFTLYDSNWVQQGAPVETTGLAYSQSASFTLDIPAGTGQTYYLCEEARTGYSQSFASRIDGYFNFVDVSVANASPNSVTEGPLCAEIENIENGEIISHVFGNTPLVRLNVSKYDDADGSGDFNAEALLAGWTINLYRINDDATWTYIEEVITTDLPDDGSAYFLIDADTNYAVCEETQDGWTQTDPDPGIPNNSLSTNPGANPEATNCEAIVANAQNWGDEIERDFGNQASGGSVLGDTDTNNPGQNNSGSVLGASDENGNVLAATGQSTLPQMILGLILITSPLLIKFINAKRSNT